MSPLIPFTITLDEHNGIDVDISEKDIYCVLVNNNATVADNKNDAVAELCYALDYSYCCVNVFYNATFEDLKTIVSTLDDTAIDKDNPIEHAKDVLMRFIEYQHEDFVIDVALEVADYIMKELLAKKLVPMIFSEYLNLYSLRPPKDGEQVGLKKIDQFSRWFAKNYIFNVAKKSGHKKPGFIQLFF